MDRAPIAAALLALAACGPDPSFVTSRGVEVYLDGHDAFLTRAQADAMEAHLVEGLPSIGYDRARLESCLGSAVVHVVDMPYTCHGNRPCAGDQQGRTLHVGDTGCAYTSAYVHEVAHWMQECVKNGYDPEHADDPVWQLVRAFHLRCDTVPVVPSD